MKFEIAKSDLDAALSVAGIATTSGTDLSSHYLFRIKDGKVEVLTTVSRVFARAGLICTHEGKEGESFTVEAWRLDKWVSGVSDGVIKLSSDVKGEVQASAAKSKIKLKSLDPSKFPFWDDLLKTSVSSGHSPPDVLAKALNLARGSVSSDDTAKPELCQIEAIKGVVWATDRKSLCSIKIPSLPDLGIRLAGKDVALVCRFLSLKQTLEGFVEIKEAVRPPAEGGGGCAIFLRPDGSYVGATRPTLSFPTINVDRDAVHETTIKINREEFNEAISALSAGAPKGHESVVFQYDPKSDVLSLAMPCDAGGNGDYPLSTAKVTKGEKLPSFTVDHRYVKTVLDTFGLDDYEFGVSQKGKSGFIAFQHTDDNPDKKPGNQYHSVIVWRT